MARIEGKDVQSSICEAFNLTPSDLTPKQILLVVKIAKHCRLRCRSNVALHNWIKKGFPALDISTVKVLSKFPKFSGETYDALKIVNPSLSEEAEGVEGEDKE